MGCDAITFRHASWFSEDQDDNGSPIGRELMYPPRIARSKPDWLGAVLQSPFWTGETAVEQFLKEIYTSLDNSCPRLAAMGIRALIEYIIIDKCGDHGNFTRNLEEFRSSGYVSPNQAKQIAAVIEMGHAATHRVFQPSVDDLKTSMDIVETIIADMYVHPERATKLASSIPTRKK